MRFNWNTPLPLTLHQYVIALTFVHCSSKTITSTSAAPITTRTVSNPSFETDNGWTGLTNRGSSELFAPPDGTFFAQLEAGSIISQNLGTMAADTSYTARVWTRSVNAHIPDSTGVEKGMQQTHPNLLAKGGIVLRDEKGAELAAVDIVVNPNATIVADGGVNAHDDGANVFFAGGYRMHLANSLLYQNRADTDPIVDEWQQGGENEYWGMAVGPISDLDGNLVINAIGGGHTMTDLSEEQIKNGMKVSSRIDLNSLEGTAPYFTAPPPNEWDMNDQPIFMTVLSHLGDEAPWVFDPHFCYDSQNERLYMTWGGHSTFLTEIDPNAGTVIDPATGTAPPNTEFNTHSPGIHTKILTNQPWAGLPTYQSASEAPPDWDGDAFSTQAYMEGIGLFQHGRYFYACGTYGSMGDSYTIRCCRQDSTEATAPRGPYRDKEGKVCTEFDPTTDRYPASMLLGPDGDHLVPGHPHFWREGDSDSDGGERLYLGYDFRDQIPSVREDSMAIRRLYMDDQEWPTIWMPLVVTVDTGMMPELVGQELTLELRAGGDDGSRVGFDHVSVVTTVTTAVPTAKPTSTPTTAPRATPTIAPTEQPAPKSCVNNPKYRLNNQKKKNCAFITIKESRRQKLCQQLIVRKECPSSCGVEECCADSVKFKFRINKKNKKKRGCAWINASKKRRAFCDKTRVKAECVNKCNNCQTTVAVKVLPAKEDIFYN